MLKGLLIAALVWSVVQARPLAPAFATATVPTDPDDPAIWVHPTDPSKSLIFGTDKVAGHGGLYVFDLQGRLKKSIPGLDRPNNVDVEYSVALGGAPADVVVLTERLQHRLRIFEVVGDGGDLRDLAPVGLPVLVGATEQEREPMGIALYRRSRDGALFAIVAPKTGPASGYLWQYRIDGERGRVTGRFVRRFGAFSRRGPTAAEIGEIEAVVVDDELGYVYYSDERFGIHKWHADPDHPQAGQELAVLGRTGYQGDREGLAIYTQPGGDGYLVSSDQVPGATRLVFYSRTGTTAAPHAHRLLGVVPTAADSTDGLDVTSRALPGLPAGMLVMMNSSARNFLVYDWRDVAARLDQATR